MNKWKIYYSDESTFDYNQGAPHEAPPEGVICIVGFKNNGKRYIAHGGAIDGPSKGYAQFFCFDQETEEWWGVDYAGLLDRLRRNLIYAFKEGRSVKDELFQKIMNDAHIDPEFRQI